MSKHFSWAVSVTCAVRKGEKLQPHHRREGDNTWKSSWSGYDLGFRVVSRLSGQQHSVLSNSNTPQSTLAAGSQPAQWQRTLINAIPHLSSEPHCLLCLEHFSCDLRHYHVIYPLKYWNHSIFHSHTTHLNFLLPLKTTQNNTHIEQRKVTELILFP